MSAAGATVQDRIAELVAALEGKDDPHVIDARELVQRVLELHAQGLAAVMAILSAAEPPVQSLIERLVADRKVLPLLLLHGVHPHSLERRVGDAVERLRAELGTRNIRLEVVSVSLRHTGLKASLGVYEGTHNAAAIRAQIEAAVLGLAPEVERLDIDGLPESGDIAVVAVNAVRRAS